MRSDSAAQHLCTAPARTEVAKTTKRRFYNIIILAAGHSFTCKSCNTEPAIYNPSLHARHTSTDSAYKYSRRSAVRPCYY